MKLGFRFVLLRGKPSITKIDLIKHLKSYEQNIGANVIIDLGHGISPDEAFF